MGVRCRCFYRTGGADCLTLLKRLELKEWELALKVRERCEVWVGMSASVSLRRAVFA